MIARLAPKRLAEGICCLELTRGPFPLETLEDAANGARPGARERAGSAQCGPAGSAVAAERPGSDSGDLLDVFTEAGGPLRGCGLDLLWDRHIEHHFQLERGDGDVKWMRMSSNDEIVSSTMLTMVITSLSRRWAEVENSPESKGRKRQQLRQGTWYFYPREQSKSKRSVLKFCE